MMTPDAKNKPPTAQDSQGDDVDKMSADQIDWVRRARSAYRASTTYMDTNLRKQWEDAIRAFNNQHSTDSKYNQPAYEKRSRLFRPKIRSIIRKNEAAAAAAFFSNMDVVSVEGMDPANKVQAASAEGMKQLLKYRLKKSIPWFHVLLGGLQDAQSTGVVCAHLHWDYQEEIEQEVDITVTQPAESKDEEYPKQDKLPDGAMVAMERTENNEGDPIGGDSGPITMATVEPKEPKKRVLSDKPVVELLPAENLRIDPSANWMDPINSSPYVIHMIPMYVMDVKDKMESGEWYAYSDGDISNTISNVSDSTRAARQKDREDPHSTSDKGVQDYEICWVQKHIHRKGSKDFIFYMLGENCLLTDPEPLEKVVFHGKRPYVMGCCVLEAHKTYPSSIGLLGKGLQDEANEVVNQRIDNVKFVLNKKWFVKRGKEADIGGLLRNVPGGIVMLDDPEKDVREITWPDVTASAYEEQSRIDNDMNDLLGNFSPAQVMADHGIQGPARNMQLLTQATGTLVEYLLLTYVKTFVEPVLNQLVLLEQEYETDQTILAVAAKQAKLMQRFGVDQLTDDMLSQEMTLTVDVGMNATDPMQKLQKFITAMKAYVEMLKEKVPGLDMGEVGKEIFGRLGYSDGSRFFTSEDPQKVMLEQQLQQAMQLIQQLQSQVKEKMTGHQVKAAAAKMQAESKIITTQIKEDGLNQRNVVTHLRALREDDRSRVHELNLKSLELAARSGSQRTLSEGLDKGANK